MLNKLILMSMVIVLAVGCSNQIAPEPFVIEDQQLHMKTSGQGEQLFAFIVTVEQQQRMQVDHNRPMSRGELKRYAKEQHIEDSSALKLRLEEQAVELLQQQLDDADYCQTGHKVEQVFWRDRSVQLRGKCRD